MRFNGTRQSTSTLQVNRQNNKCYRDWPHSLHYDGGLRLHQTTPNRKCSDLHEHGSYLDSILRSSASLRKNYLDNDCSCFYGLHWSRVDCSRLFITNRLCLEWQQSHILSADNQCSSCYWIWEPACIKDKSTSTNSLIFLTLVGEPYKRSGIWSGLPHDASLPSKLGSFLVAFFISFRYIWNLFDITQDTCFQAR